jgi:hypothetical protein
MYGYRDIAREDRGIWAALTREDGDRFMITHVRLVRRQFLVGIGAVFAQTGIQTAISRPARAQQTLSASETSGVGVVPGYIWRGEAPSNPFFRAQGGPVNQRGPRPKMVHGRGIEEDSQ